MNSEQYSNLQTLLREALERANDSILTCELEAEEIEDLMNAIN